MKILILTPFLPYPPQAGNRLRAFHWLSYLRKKHQIYLVSFIESINENSYLKNLMEYCADIITVLRRPKCGFMYRVMNLFKKPPYFIVEQFKSSTMQESITRLLENNRFDLILVSSLAMLQYVDNVKGINKILDSVDCITRNYSQSWKVNTGFMDRIKSSIDYRKIREYEVSLHTKVDRCIVATSEDREFLECISPGLIVRIIPNGVDSEYFSPQPVEEDFPSLLFFGDMSYTPNKDAVVYLCLKILPLVKSSFPKLRVYIVGKNNPKINKCIPHEKGVIITGFVEDIRIFLSKASVSVCPMRIGTGIKNKVLEAMAMGKAVVSSSIGKEGIEASNGKDILIADSHESFAQRITELLRDKNLREKIGRNARELMEKNHQWEMQAQKIEAVFQELQI
ncbi:hypothetical protein AC481_05555 [miscellaneous Crenarchaeota group archaeon SMTZ-80]|nr:MAG: hypothetical protein AC481_05555 [miscellaneous Crenarchaeota group archaeon SMTZ-80]